MTNTQHKNAAIVKEKERQKYNDGTSFLKSIKFDTRLYGVNSDLNKNRSLTSNLGFNEQHGKGISLKNEQILAAKTNILS